MKLGYVILYVESVPDSLAFYERAFGFERGLVAPTNDYGELNTGVTRLAFAANAFVRTHATASFEPAARERSAPPMELGFVTDDVEGIFSRAVTAGAIAVKAPEAKPWGQLVGYVRDLDGFTVEICSPMAA